TGAQLDRLARHEQRYQRTIHRCYRELRQLRKDNLDDLDPCPYFDYPEQVFHLNPTDIPRDESTWPEVQFHGADDEDNQNEATDLPPPSSLDVECSMSSPRDPGAPGLNVGCSSSPTLKNEPTDPVTSVNDG